MNKRFLSTTLFSMCLLAATIAFATAVPQRVLELPPSANNPRNSEGDFAVLKDGRILFIYSHYTSGNGGDHDPAVLAARYSADGGNTWTATSEVVVKNEGGMNVMSVSLLRLRNGKLGLFYLLKNSEEDCRPMLRISSDEGKTWDKPIKCIPDSEKNYYVLNNARATYLKSGRLVLPMCVHAAKNGRTSDWYGKLICYFSDDDGLTWKHSRNMFATFDSAGKRITTQEPGVIELKDGRVLMYARTGSGKQWFYYSCDGCVNFTKGVPGTLWGPCGPATLRRLSTGDILAIWNDHEYLPTYAAQDTGWGQRVPLTVAISKDECRTWQPRHTLEGNPQGWYCYIAAMEYQGNVLLGYCAMSGLAHSRITKVPVSWLYETSMAAKPDSTVVDSVFKTATLGACERVENKYGVWTASAGNAEIINYSRGYGLHLLGGTNRVVTLTLPQAADSDTLKLYVERYTARAPYTFKVEAQQQDGTWQQVYEEGDNTGVGSLRAMTFTKLPQKVTAYRFTCTSVLGAILSDVAVSTLNGFFND